jgi:hypothetical protein
MVCVARPVNSLASQLQRDYHDSAGGETYCIGQQKLKR